MPPSEEGGVTAYKGLKRRDGRRDTPSMCESSKYRRVLNNNDTCITLCMPTPWCKQQPRVLSPSVAPLYPLGAPALPPRRSPLVLRLFALAPCGRQRLAFLAASATGGARKPNPSEGAEAATAARHRIASVSQPHQNVRARRAHLNICHKGANISHARSAYFTAPKARFHTAATLPYFTAALCGAEHRHTL